MVRKIIPMMMLMSVYLLSCSGDSETNGAGSTQADSLSETQRAPGNNTRIDSSAGMGDSTSTSTSPGNDTSTKIMNTGPNTREKKKSSDSTPTN